MIVIFLSIYYIYNMNLEYGRLQHTLCSLKILIMNYFEVMTQNQKKI